MATPSAMVVVVNRSHSQLSGKLWSRRAISMSQAETAALLMKASFAQRRVQYHQQWQAVVRIAAQTRGWWLTYGSLNDALDMVDHLTAARAETGETQAGGKE